VGALLRAAWKGVRDHIDEAVKAAGYVDLNRAHVSLFRHPTLDGMRPTDLADEVQLSKQAVNDLLGDLEHQGYIRREVDSADRRSRLIRLTPRGIKLEDTVRLAARGAERQLERELGRERFRSFREALVEAARISNGRA
jgi:DNA-binding MarR family transcriptional regulator